MSAVQAAGSFAKEDLQVYPVFRKGPRASLLTSPTFMRFERLSPMTDADRWALADMMEAPRKVAAYREVVSAGERAGGLRLIHRGFACRYIDVSNGQRQ